MRRLRIVHAVSVLISGLALAVLIYGPLRFAVALLVLVIIIQAWSLEMIRVIAFKRPETRS